MALPTDGGPLRIGSPFADKYEIKGLIGHGGQAWVYRGQHTFTGREVAIKIIHAPYGVTHEMLERAKAEAQALAKLDHPNVVTLHDAGVTAEGHLYILMELLEGCSLGAVLKAHGRLQIEETFNLLIQAADAVHQAHKRRIIHRDLKPDNLFVIRGDHEGHGNPLKVLDFGIAKMLDEIGFTTRKDVVIGTVLYMSPEQVQGLPITEQSDIYALGLILWEALIGKRPSVLIFEQDLIERGEPFRRPGIADIPPIQAHRIPPLLTELDPSIPLYVSQLVQRAIAKVARQRFSTMGDFAAAMRVCLTRYLAEVPPSIRPATARDLSQFVAGPTEPEAAPISQRVTTEHAPSSSALSAHAASAALTVQAQLSTALHGPRGINAERFEEAPLTTSTLSSLIGVETQPLGTSVLVAQKTQQGSIAGTLPPERSAPVERAPKSTPPGLSPKRTMLGPVKSPTLPPVALNGRGPNVATANRIKIRNALVRGGLLGLALGVVLVIPLKRALPRAAGGASTPTIQTSANSSAMPTAVSSAAPIATSVGAPGAVASAAAAVDTPATVTTPTASTTAATIDESAVPVHAHARRAPAAAHPPSAHPAKAVSSSTSEGQVQRLLPIESGLDTEPGASPVPNSSAKPRKRAIYGD